jgi:hypothetical protein
MLRQARWNSVPGRPPRHPRQADSPLRSKKSPIHAPPHAIGNAVARCRSRGRCSHRQPKPQLALARLILSSLLTAHALRMPTHAGRFGASRASVWRKCRNSVVAIVGMPPHRHAAKTPAFCNRNAHSGWHVYTAWVSSSQAPGLPGLHFYALPQGCHQIWRDPCQAPVRRSQLKILCIRNWWKVVCSRTFLRRMMRSVYIYIMLVVCISSIGCGSVVVVC